MLSFILSKMQMLLFASGIFVVVLLLFNFTSGIELGNITQSMVQENASLVEGQIHSTSLNSFKINSIPERIKYAASSQSLFYDLVFSREKVGSKKHLIIYIRDHLGKKILASKSIIFDGNVILVDPNIIGNYDESLENYIYFDDNTKYNDSGFEKDIFLYPRGYVTKNKAIPNAYVVLKETRNANTNIYIIPCSSSFIGSPSANAEIPNCTENILRVGCYLIKKDNSSPSNDDEVRPAFDMADTDVLQNTSSWNSTTAIVGDSLTWKTCVDYGLVK